MPNQYTNEEAQVLDGLGLPNEPKKEPIEAPVNPGRTLKVKYNGEDKELNEQDAITYAQKGMDYDKVREQRDGYRSQGADEALEVEKLIADSYDMTVAEYRKFARENVSKQARDKELEAIYKESPNISEKLANELADTRIAAKGKARAEKEEDANAEKWAAVAAEYPDYKTAEDLPEDVRTAVSGGKDPMLAMREHDISELRKQLESQKNGQAAKQTNEENEKRALGSMKSNDPNYDEIANILWKG